MDWKHNFPKENRYFETTNGILYCGDCINILPLFLSTSIDLVITDPPYGVLDINWDQISLIPFTIKWWVNLQRIKKENSSFYIFWSQKYLKEGLGLFNPDRVLIWHHPNLAIPTSKMFLWTYDPIFYIIYGKPIFNAVFTNSENVDVLKYAKPQRNYKKDKRFHPTQKPLELIKLFVKLSSNEDSIILDPFVGSGTTALASELLHRKWIAIEINEEYCQIVKERLLNIESQGELF